MNKSPKIFKRATWVLTALMCLSLGPPGFAQSNDPAYYGKFDEVVREAVRSGQGVRAIVRFKDEAARQRGHETVGQRGGGVRRALNTVRALNVIVDASTADLLAQSDDVVGLSIDAEVRSASSAQRAARSSGAAKVRDHYNRRGNGIAIAVIDSGVQPHADLPASRIRAFVDFVNGRTQPYDDFGHGTHVAGIAAGSGALGGANFAGAAPSVDIVALKVLDANGAGATSDVIAALDWVAANHRAYNIKVVNMSLGHPVFEPAASDPLVQAAQALVRLGIVVVASAGNLGLDPRDNQPGFGGITSPANGPDIIAVGAVDNKGTEVRSDDRVTDYSSKGPTRFDLIAKPDIVASGHRVVSLSAPGSYLFSNYPALHVSVGSQVAEYMILSGTSMAAPSVAGAAALLFESNPKLSAHTVRAVLEFTAQDLPETSLLEQGAGYLNTFGAVRLASAIKPKAPIGTVWLKKNTLPTEFDELYGETVSWAQNIVWGQRVLLGDSAYLHMAAWEDNIVWGQCDGGDSGCDNIVWGQCDEAGCDNIVWGQCGDDGCENIVWGQDGDNIVWGQCNDDGCDNIVWGQIDDLDNIVWGQCSDANCDNIVWGQEADNIVWGQCHADECDNIVWGQTDDNIVWGQCTDEECSNIVWGQCGDEGCDNIVWGQSCDADSCDNIVWGQNGVVQGYWAGNTVWGFWDDSVLWSTVTKDNIVWGQDYLDNIVWGQDGNDNIVWGQCETDSCDNIVWGQSMAVLTEGGR